MALRFVQWNQIPPRIKQGLSRKAEHRGSVHLPCKGMRPAGQGTWSGWFFHPAQSTLPLEPASLFTNSITSALPSDLPPRRLPANRNPFRKSSWLIRLALGTKGSSFQLASDRLPRVVSGTAAQLSCIALRAGSPGCSKTPTLAAKITARRGKTVLLRTSGGKKDTGKKNFILKCERKQALY